MDIGGSQLFLHLLHLADRHPRRPPLLRFEPFIIIVGYGGMSKGCYTLLQEFQNGDAHPLCRIPLCSTIPLYSESSGMSISVTFCYIFGIDKEWNYIYNEGIAARSRR